MGFWQDYDVRPDPWALEYGSPVALEDSQASRAVEVDVEGVPWGAISPPAELQMPRTLAFVDGRRRLDGRAIGKDGDRILYGAFATVAAGVIEVDCSLQRAHFPIAATVERVVAFGGDRAPEPVTLPGPPGNPCTLDYSRVLTDVKKSNGPQVPLNCVQNYMRKIEVDLAAQYSHALDTLVIQDGDLRGFGEKMGVILGYVKTLHATYLPQERNQILWELRSGKRTPIFTIERNRFPYWSWYLRSGREGQGSLHGIVRMEIFRNKASLDRAQQIANWSCHVVPKYASEPLRDPRAPQNLMPVNALENWLGRQMGNPAIVQRCVKQFLNHS